MGQMSDYHQNERGGSHPTSSSRGDGRGSSGGRRCGRYGRGQCQKSAFIADIEEDDDDEGENDASPECELEIPEDEDDDFDDVVEDESLAEQLNTFAEIEGAHAGETITAAACAATIQLQLQANVAWDVVGARKPNGKREVARKRKR